MRINDLRECVVLAETLSFTETARRLYTTQSAVSKHIQSLEQDLGATLFMRNQHGVLLTKAGRIFADNAKLVLQHYESTLIALDRLKSGVDGTLNIGCLAGSSWFFISNAFNRFLAQYPNIDLQPMSMEIDGILEAFDSDTIDLGVTTEFIEFPQSRFSTVPLYTDHIAVIVPRNHALAQRESVSIRDLRGETILLPNPTFMVREAPPIKNLLLPISESIVVKENANDIMALFLLMRTKRYVTLMFEHVRNFSDLDSEFKYLRLEECPQDFNVVAVWKRSAENDIIVDMARIMQEEVQASAAFPKR